MNSTVAQSLAAIAGQLFWLNTMIAIYLFCKGIGYATAIVMRRDPPIKKAIRQSPAPADGSKSKGPNT